MVGFGVILFGAAGTLRWPAAWVFLILYFGAMAGIDGMLLRRDTALLAERMKWPGQKGQPLWDRVLTILLKFLFVAWLVLMGFDAVRFHWSTIPISLQSVGALGVALSMWAWYLVFRENTFASAVVRIQTERGHKVISTGPYSVVRHPMYASAIVQFISTSLLLGSCYGLLWSILMVVPLFVRTVLEDRALNRNLEGYREYAERVRWRIVPHVW